MENASKALIIAGAILISILLISIGIIVMNSINDPVDQAGDQASSQAIEMFNAKFTGYAGTQKASAIKALMVTVAASNAANANHPITVYGEDPDIGSTTNIGEIQANLSNQKEYIVTFTYGIDGYISHIDIEKK